MPRRIVLLLLAISLIPAMAAVAGGDNRNAATWYRRAIVHLDKITESDWDLIWSYWDNPSAEPPPGFREMVAKVRPMLDLMQRGAQQEYMDFDLDYSLGFEMPVTHLQKLRTIAKLARADVMLHLHDGDSNAAAKRIAMMYRLAEHYNGDRTLISSLVGQATFKFANGIAQVGVDRAAFTVHDSETMLRALKRLDTRDPFGMTEGMIGEQEFSIDWLMRQFGTEEDRLANAETLRVMMGDVSDEQWQETADVFASMTDGEFDAALGEYDLMMDRVVEAFTMEDSEAGRADLQRLVEEIEAGEHGPIAKALFVEPWFLRVFEQMADARVEVAQRMRFLEGVVTGEVKLEDEANAAFYYAQGIELLKKIEAERFDAVCAFEKGEAGKPDEGVIETLKSTQAIVDLFREGSCKKRCDFTFLRADEPLALCPEYVAGMRDAFRLLHGDAMRFLRDGEADAAADRLAICYRVIGHLSGDEPILSALVAHHAFDRTHRLASGALGSGAATNKHGQALLDAAERIGRKDPFGYIGSIVTAREAIVRRLAGREMPSEAVRRRREEMAATVMRWDGDELLYCLAIFDTMIRAGEQNQPGDESAPPTHPIDRLDDVLSLEELERARREVPLVAPILARGEAAIFDGRDIPRFGRVVERMRFARRDLRAGLALLRPAPSATGPEDED
jgi:hypothetical protein